MRAQTVGASVARPGVCGRGGWRHPIIVLSTRSAMRSPTPTLSASRPFLRFPEQLAQSFLHAPWSTASLLSPTGCRQSSSRGGAGVRLPATARGRSPSRAHPRALRRRRSGLLAGTFNARGPAHEQPHTQTAGSHAASADRRGPPAGADPLTSRDHPPRCRARRRRCAEGDDRAAAQLGKPSAPKGWRSPSGSSPTPIGALYIPAGPGALRRLVRVATAAMGARDPSMHDFPIAV